MIEKHQATTMTKINDNDDNNNNNNNDDDDDDKPFSENGKLENLIQDADRMTRSYD